MQKNQGKYEPIFLRDQIRALDQAAISSLGLAGFLLMSRAGQASYHQCLKLIAYLKAQWQQCQLKPQQVEVQTVLLIGSGNNGGDAWIVASEMLRVGMPHHVITLADPVSLQGDARLAFQQFDQLGGLYQAWQPDCLFHYQSLAQPCLFIDGLLGTGLAQAVRKVQAEAIQSLNLLKAERLHRDLPTQVLALDIPSGLCADRGLVLGHCVQADVTYTFVGLKAGLLMAEGPDYVGQLYFSDLGIDLAFRQQQPHQGLCLQTSPLPIATGTHKKTFGSVLVIAGDQGYGGAGLLAAYAALKSGSGLVTLATRQSHLTAALAFAPEVMTYSAETFADLKPLLDRADHILIGPGLGQKQWGQEIMHQTLLYLAAQNFSGVVVIDADGLNLLAQDRSASFHLKPILKQLQIIYTPHPGEAWRLAKACGGLSQGVQQNRLAALAFLSSHWPGHWVLKGKGTLLQVQGDDQFYICPFGNSNLAVAGTGDVLAGTILGVIACAGISKLDDLKADQIADLIMQAVQGHALAADRLKKQGIVRGLAASQLPEVISYFIYSDQVSISWPWCHQPLSDQAIFL